MTYSGQAAPAASLGSAAYLQALIDQLVDLSSRVGSTTLRALVSQQTGAQEDAITPLRTNTVTAQPMSALATRKPAAAATPSSSVRPGPAGRTDTAEGGGYVG